MWIGQVPRFKTQYPEIHIQIFSKKGVGALRLWNYNKGLKQANCGVKELEIYVNGSPKWFGIVNKGPGNRFEEYVTEVMLMPGVRLPSL